MRINVSGARPEHAINGLEIDVNEGVDGLRRRIGERIGAPPDRLRIIHMGRLIDGSRPLESFLQDNSIVHVVVSPEPPSNNNNNGGDGEREVIGGEEFTASFMSPPGFAEFLANFVPDIGNAVIGNGRDGVPIMMSVARTVLPAAIQAVTRSGGAHTAPQQSRPRQQQAQRMPERAQGGLHTQAPHRPTRVQHEQEHPTTEAASLHIHIHLTPSELSGLPDHLEQLGRRIHLPPPTTVTHVEGASVTGVGRQAPDREGEQVPISGPHGSNEGSAVAADESGSDEHHLLFNLLRNMISSAHHGPPNEADFGTRGLLNTLHRTVLSEDSTVFLQLYQGNIENIAPHQARIVEATVRWVASGQQPPFITAEEIRQRVEREADRIACVLRGNEELMRAFEEERRPGVNVAAEMRRFVIYAHERIIETITCPSVSGSAWVRAIRNVFVSMGGIIMERASTWFTRGMDSVARLCPLFLRSIIQWPVPLDENTAALLPNAFERAIPPALLEFQQYYQSLSRRAPDIFSSDELATATAEAGGENEVLDRCLDRYLEEFCGSQAGDSPQADTEVPTEDHTGELEGALRAVGTFSEEVSEDIVSRAQRFCHEAPSGRAGERSSMWKKLERR